jgi:hypothetical protein
MRRSDGLIDSVDVDAAVRHKMVLCTHEVMHYVAENKRVPAMADLVQQRTGDVPLGGSERAPR